jgi:hypothetical protein
MTTVFFTLDADDAGDNFHQFPLANARADLAGCAARQVDGYLRPYAGDDFRQFRFDADHGVTAWTNGAPGVDWAAVKAAILAWS